MSSAIHNFFIKTNVKCNPEKEEDINYFYKFKICTTHKYKTEADKEAYKGISASNKATSNLVKHLNIQNEHHQEAYKEYLDSDQRVKLAFGSPSCLNKNNNTPNKKIQRLQKLIYSVWELF